MTDVLQKAAQGFGMSGGIVIELEDTIVTGRLKYPDVETVSQTPGLRRGSPYTVSVVDPTDPRPGVKFVPPEAPVLAMIEVSVG